MFISSCIVTIGMLLQFNWCKICNKRCNLCNFNLSIVESNKIKCETFIFSQSSSETLNIRSWTTGRVATYIFEVFYILKVNNNRSGISFPLDGLHKEGKVGKGSVTRSQKQICVFLCVGVFLHLFHLLDECLSYLCRIKELPHHLESFFPSFRISKRMCLSI